jgi:hypothetical protein
MDGRLPLPTLLSHALAAFTIEFDNESERQMLHRTTRHGSTTSSLHAPWLVSLVMWSNCMQFVTEEGVPIRELERRARTTTNLAGMQRWGYIVIEPDPADRRPKPPRSAWVVRATPAGRKAQEVWRPLFLAIEKRWQERFGKIDQLRESLWAVASNLDVELPDCLPVLRCGLFSRGPEFERRASAQREEHGTRSLLPLSALLSRVLLAFAMEFERDSDLSLAISANVVRVLDETGGAGPRSSASDRRLKGGNQHGDGRPPEETPCRGRGRPVRQPSEGRSPYPEGSTGSGQISSTARHHRRALAGALWNGYHPLPSRVAGAVGRRAHRATLASVSGVGALP